MFIGHGYKGDTLQLYSINVPNDERALDNSINVPNDERSLDYSINVPNDSRISFCCIEQLIHISNPIIIQ